MPKLIPPVVEPGTLAGREQPAIVVDDDLELRPWVPGDAPFVVEAYSNPDIQHWHFRRYETIEEAQAWIEAELAGWHDEKAASWAVVRRATGEAIGRVALYPVLMDGYAEISYWVVPEARGEGVATRVTVAATQWAHQLGLHRVQLEHSTRNDRSRRVAVRAGFISEGIRRGSNLHEDGWHDMQMYSHLSTDAPGVVIGEPGGPADGPAAIAPEGL
jgi:RimJ/RimL family protein N-acetyltransferase